MIFAFSVSDLTGFLFVSLDIKEVSFGFSDSLGFNVVLLSTVFISSTCSNPLSDDSIGSNGISFNALSIICLFIIIGLIISGLLSSGFLSSGFLSSDFLLLTIGLSSFIGSIILFLRLSDFKG